MYWLQLLFNEFSGGPQMGLCEQSIIQKWRAWMHLLLNQREVRSWRTGMQNKMLAWPGTILYSLTAIRALPGQEVQTMLIWMLFLFLFWVHKPCDLMCYHLLELKCPIIIYEWSLVLLSWDALSEEYPMYICCFMPVKVYNFTFH